MTEIDTKPTKYRQHRFWAIALPLLLQTGLIFVVPLQSAITARMGTTVVLQTRPVDPFDPFRGYYVTLRYDISQRGVLSRLDNWDTLKTDLTSARKTDFLAPGRSFYVILEAPENSQRRPVPTPWRPIAVSRQRPRNLPANQLALKGLYRSDRALYGLERYYLSDAQRLDLEQQIRDAQAVQVSPRLRVEVRIGPFGRAVPIALWIEDQRLEF
ncbi:MAG: GDYXXLXY domain-containing protein [Cyanobacteria bacterium P01_F01_bin.86]